MESPGPVWLFSGVSYPSNVGAALRTADVTGAAGVVVDGPFNRKARVRALRVSMRADRFIPVFWEDSLNTVTAAKAAGRRIVAVEDTGTQWPWETDLRTPCLLIVGGEHDGISQPVQAQCDSIIRLPMPGFIPSWSVQAAVAAVAAECLRQQHQG